jgi:hypothetical protein
VEDTTSIIFPRYQHNENFKYTRTLGLDETQEMDLAITRFKKLWLDHDVPWNIACDVDSGRGTRDVRLLSSLVDGRLTCITIYGMVEHT